ncbi:hypothetical protein BDY19DRAFT_1060448 [Irpex rosettiformis]|uniref:Uncharacterized protein n=1 Tax=Irpex rosettiformis TaxID=378272 RepID=A0ACB8TQF7_9APHY|nr:hypothetical protein BDY19DRAFT_1060448 [Irpex rosettiformis]
MVMSNDLISMQKDSGSQESQETVRAMAFCSLKALMYSWHALIMKYRSRSTSRFLAQQATIERLVQHHTFGNSVASIRQLHTATNERPSLRLMKNLSIHWSHSPPLSTSTK